MNLSSVEKQNELAGMWAWLLPAAYLFHVAEEAFGGHGRMGSSAVEVLAMAFGKRSSDHCYQWHLAHCRVRDGAILCSGSMDRSSPLCTRRLYPFVLAATCYVAMGFCVRDSYWDSDP
jgi:hypothetical protein